MGQKITFNLPDLGEGLTEGEVAAWLVEPGGEVKLNQPFVEVETAKALVEVPSPYDGVLAEHHATPGTTVDVGSPLATFEVEGAEAPPQQKEEKRTPNLVGYGAREAGSKRRKRRTGAESAVAPVEAPAPTAPVAVPEPPPAPAPAPAAPAAPAVPSGPVLAKPPVRKLAKDLGVDLASVVPTGPNGTVSRADVESAVIIGWPPRPRTSASPSRGCAS
jgi:pyruvate dehydrogenase E2 component (dihydrolipoamide acetyltransferase)